MTPYLWMLGGSLAYAVMGTLTHSLGAHCDWRIIAIARAVVPLVLMAAIAARAKVKLPILRPATLWIRSLAGSASILCTFFALSRVPVSDVLTLTNVFPLWVAILSWPLFGERPSASVWVAVVLGVVGVVLVEQPHFARGDYAILAAFASSLLTAAAMLGLHRLRGVDPRAIVFHFSFVASAFCVAVAWAGPPRRLASTPEHSAWLALASIGVLATVGQLFFTRAFADGPPTKVSLVGLTQIVFAVGLDRFYAGRAFDATTLAGIALVLLPTAWVMWREARA